MVVLQAAILRLANPQQRISLPISREAVGNPELWERHYISLVGGNLQAFKSNTINNSEEINESSAESNNFDSAWHADAAAKFLGFFNVGHASADEQTRAEHAKNNTTKIVVHYKNIASFPIKRGEWFDENVIQRFARELTPTQRDILFGKNGQLEIIPQELIVARGLSFSIYADADSRDFYSHHFSAGAGGGFGIGYFTVGLNGNYSENQSKTTTHSFSDHVDVEDVSGRPFVIAVIAKRYGPQTGLPVFGAPAMIMGTAPRTLDALWVSSNVLKSVTGSVTPKQTKAIESIPGNQ